MKKLFIIQKYIVATSIVHALKIEKNAEVNEIWLDDDWKKAHKPECKNEKVGFKRTKKKNTMAKKTPMKKGGKKC